MKKRFSRIALVLLVLMLSLPLFADGKIAVWQWQLDDPQVTGFRYQLNSDDPANWTYVAADVDTYEYEITDPSQELTLYLQRSYDGLNWSEAAVSSVIIEQPASAVASEEAASDSATASAVASASSASHYEFSLLLKAGVGNRFSTSPVFADGWSRARIDLGVAFDFANIKTFGDHFGIGVRADLFTQVIPADRWSTVGNGNFFKNIDFDTSFDVKVMFQYETGSIAAYAGTGIGYSLYNQANTDDAITTHTLARIKPFGISFDTAIYVPFVLGARYSFNDTFSLGLEGYGRWLFPANKFVGSADLVFGFTF